MSKYLLFIALLLALHSYAQPEAQKKLQTRFILAEDGAVIEIDSGFYSLSSTLSIEGKNNLVIRGRGMEKTILSFKGQKSGAEGIRVSNGTNIRFENLTVQDAKGDCIKAMHVNGITFRNVTAQWTGKLTRKNGSYALYPVLCEKVLVEYCVARGSSDAGIYVGQSRDIIVRHNKAFENVAGIEIENSIHADVYGNEVTSNTGGILVFDLPDLEVKQGGYCRVFDNIIKGNNLSNFAPKGNIVAKVPQGTGILLLAARQVEVFNNQILENRTVGTGIVSYYITENPIRDSSYYPYPTAIHVHDNTYQKKKRRATMEGRMGKLYRFKLRFGKNVPDIIFDGVPDKDLFDSTGRYTETTQICIRNNKGAGFANLDAANNFKNISRDPSLHDCSRSTLPSVNL